MKVGDRVKVRDERFLFLQKAGESGVIVKLDNNDAGVEFPIDFGGHNCHGAGKSGHCFYIEKNI